MNRRFEKMNIRIPRADHYDRTAGVVLGKVLQLNEAAAFLIFGINTTLLFSVMFSYLLLLLFRKSESYLFCLHCVK